MPLRTLFDPARSFESQQILRQILDHTPQFLFWKDRNLVYLGCNQKFAEAVGLSSPEDIIGKTDYDLPWLKEEAESFRARDREVIATRTPQLHIIETQHEKDGTVIWVDVSKVPLFTATGEVFGILGSYQDITERKRAEETLRDQERKLRTINSLVPGMIYQYETDIQTQISRFTYASGGAIDLFEVEPDQITADVALIWDMIHPEDLPRIQESAAISILRGAAWKDTFRVILPSGQEKWIQGQSECTFTDHDRVMLHSGVFLDISDRKQIESDLKQTLSQLRSTQTQLIQSEKMSSLGQLVGGVAHEINNPVNFISANLAPAEEYIQNLLELVALYQKCYPVPDQRIQNFQQAIEVEFLADDLQNLLASMKHGADRIRKIVLSLRTFSRMDESEFKSVNLHEGIDSTLMILQHRLKEKSDRPAINVEKIYADLPNVECYAGQLNQVFMNLLTNAIDAIEEANPPDPTLKITTEQLTPDRVVIRIRDNGVGIPQQGVDRLFDPFFTTKEIGKGTGLGLSISYQVIEKHHGEIHYQSEPGKGTEFSIEIPIQHLASDLKIQ